MWEALQLRLAALRRAAGPLLRRATDASLAFVRLAWRLIKPPLLALLQLIAALVLLFEEWGWRPLAAALAYLSRFRPWARLELWIAGLPPYGALAVFTLPTAILMPLKFLAVWLLANSYFVTASLLFVGAKIASTAFVARIFMLTKPALMQIGWFARAYEWFMPWKEAIFARIRQSRIWRQGRAIKRWLRFSVRQAWSRWRPWLLAQWHEWLHRLRAALPRWVAAVRTAWRSLRPEAIALYERSRVATRRMREWIMGH